MYVCIYECTVDCNDLEYFKIFYASLLSQILKSAYAFRNSSILHWCGGFMPTLSELLLLFLTEKACRKQFHCKAIVEDNDDGPSKLWHIIESVLESAQCSLTVKERVY